MNLTFGKIIAVILIAFLTILGGFQYGTSEEVTFIVKGKERVTTGHGANIRDKYLVYSKGETFENTDSIFHFKFSSSDIYGALKAGQKVRAKVYGFRVPLFSWYRNIVSIQVLGDSTINVPANLSGVEYDEAQDKVIFGAASSIYSANSTLRTATDVQIEIEGASVTLSVSEIPKLQQALQLAIEQTNKQ